MSCDCQGIRAVVSGASDSCINYWSASLLQPSDSLTLMKGVYKTSKLSLLPKTIKRERMANHVCTQ